MKNLPVILDNWETGTLIGNNRAQTRVTITPDWWLNLTPGTNYGTSKRGPFRWWQHELNNQTELEVPNVKSVDIDRSIDTDIASANITIYNQWMNTNGEAPEISTQLGKPGYFSWGRAKSPESIARWNQEANEWEDVFLPNAMIRTYQGYGGFNEDGTPMDIEDAVEDGFLTLTGVWLVDDVALNSSGTLGLRLRDVGKMLAVQTVYPPLVPANQYPCEFYRWKYADFAIPFNPRKPIVTGMVQERNPTYFTSSADQWYGFDADIHGHRGSHSVDGNADTYALSVGNSSPERPFCTDYFEYNVNGGINEIYVHTWAGNYTMYISVLENGAWVSNGGGDIPYDHTPLCSTQTCVDTHADIPFVTQTGTGWEEGRWYALPRVFNAQRVRVTFKNHTRSQFGPWYYRAGIREVRVRVNTLQTSPPPEPWVYTIDTFVNPDAVNESGYWAVADDGQTFGFGDARLYDKNSADGIDGKIIRLRGMPDGLGYVQLQNDGRVHTFGSAQDYGDPYNQNYQGFCDIAVTPSGEGYWVAAHNGALFAFGDATDYGSIVLNPAQESDISARFGGDWGNHVLQAICAHPTNGGLWALLGNGDVVAMGSAPDLGGVSAADRARVVAFESWTSLRTTPTGDGLYALNGDGKVAVIGAAVFFGEMTAPAPVQGLPDATLHDVFRVLTWDMAIAPQGDGAGGYFHVHGYGGISGYGEYHWYGEPGGVGTVRLDGNYKDYADLVKLFLAWSGWILCSTTPEPTDDFPPVFGNIESTGAYAEDDIPSSEWDKLSPLDCINKIKEIVGYIFYIDDQGAAHFETPNWWSIGNFWEDGTPTDYIPEIDERIHLTDYNVNYNDDPLRSEIIIATEEPLEGNETTIVTDFIPISADVLHGMVKPAMWTNGLFKNKDEQEIMAELISLHIWFQQRLGSVSCAANPCIQINDQIRIFERVTAETYVHYVRGVSTHHDLDTGEYTMTLTTHWMGDAGDWVITRDTIPPGETPEVIFDPIFPPGTVIGNPGSGGRVGISDKLRDWLDRSESRTLQVARLNNWETDPESTVTYMGEVDESEDGAAAP